MENSKSLQIAQSLLPFLIRRHNLGMDECISLIKTPIDNAIKPLIDELKKMDQLLMMLCAEGRPFEKRRQRIGELISKYEENE